MDLRSTLNLPDPDFTIPMKADLAAREPQMQARWDEAGLYRIIQDGRRGSPKFILHDGPPYTNNPIHMGTALNKSLKDFVVRYKTLRGFHCPYVPGYDTHGLPIELAVQAKKGRLEPTAMREECRRHAETFIALQSEQFRRLGILADWSHPYATLHFKYEAAVVRAFAKLAGEGFIYRDLKPTHWSIFSRTALAETELVYEDHTSTSIFVRFPLREDPERLFRSLAPIYTIIWTTTPWTIPGNLAVAFHPELEYALYESGGAYYLLYDGLAESVFEAMGMPLGERVASVLGAELEGLAFKHPIFDRDSIAVLADYVTTEDGTGVVHTAPGHGHEDFYTGRKYGLPALCPVDEGGIYTVEAGEFAGKKITDADKFVVERLRESGNLLHAHEYKHSYPYSERDKHPVIYRTTEQWFLRVDHNSLRSRALDEIRSVGWYPPQGEARITSMVEGRPDWCLSRQRVWGVGIPILFGAKSGEPVLDQAIMERAAQLVEQKGSGAWFDAPVEALVPDGYAHPATGETEFRKETDVLDVWFDSGITHLACLDEKYDPAWSDLEWPSDLYLEGSDQHRGWFNSSLMTAVALKGAAPYRNVLTHGFLVDEKGDKMSKSKGNVVDPVVAAGQYGADVLRLWAATVDYSNDVPCGDNLLKQVGENYRRIRNTLRFLLANLYDFDPSSHSAVLLDLDKWVVAKCDDLASAACSSFDEFNFSAAMIAVHNFCVRELSSFYLDAIKDRMYCDPASSPARRSGQAACSVVLSTLTKLVAPVIPHTAEEVYERTPMVERQPTVFLERLEPQPNPSADDYGFGELLAVRDRLYVALESWKAESGIKDTQDISARVFCPSSSRHTFERFGSDLPTFLKLSWVEFGDSESERFEFAESSFLKCDRCRLRRPDVATGDGAALCERCRAVVGL
jgi:isoleucyl-tRNA synthetase